MANTTLQPATPVWQRINITQILMYTVLILYAILSIFPFLFMLGTSLMTTGEATTKSSLIPGIGYQIDTENDITPCILYTRDTFEDEGHIVTKNRFIVDIPNSALEAQQYSNYSRPVYEAREEHFRLPFLTNYCAAWQQGKLGKYMWNSIKITLISVTGTVIFATLAAYAFARMDFAGKELLFGILLSTLMIPGIVQTLPNVILVTKIGEIFGSQGWFAQNLGFSFCGDARNCWINNWPALTIPFMAPAVSIFLLRQHFQSVPDELWDAARIDGAGHLRFLIQIVLPISKSALFVILLFAFIGAWNELAWPLLVTAGNDEWRPIAAGLQSFFNDEGRLPQLQMAGSMIAIFPVIILYAITQRSFIEGLSQSGLKG
jgi:ABC-type glycerol-3-phosphate transport system permease component